MAEQLLLKEGLGQTPFKSRATVSSASFHQKIKIQPCSGKGLLEKDAVDRRLGLDLGHLICKRLDEQQGHALRVLSFTGRLLHK